MLITCYSDLDAVQWDEFIATAPMGNFLHSRRFLSYHGDRFKDASLMIKNENNKLVGLFPAAVDPLDEKQVVSHPGITYGGMLHAGGLRADRMIEALVMAKDHYRDRGFKTVRYKAVPYLHHQMPSSDDLYALFRLGATCYRCDLSSAIDLGRQRVKSTRRQRGLRKALAHGVEVRDGAEFLNSLWIILEENLSRKYRVRPVHTVEEIGQLHTMFPENIEFAVGLLGGKVVAGVVLFSTAQVVHAQYIASSPLGHEVCALDAVFEHCIEMATNRGVRYFDFGISTENDGRYLNINLHQFKVEFGAGGVVHQFFELELNS